jgi:hypothetical protein
MSHVPWHTNPAGLLAQAPHVPCARGGGAVVQAVVCVGGVGVGECMLKEGGGGKGQGLVCKQEGPGHSNAIRSKWGKIILASH